MNNSENKLNTALVPISIGELFDKITILEIKLQKLSDDNGFIIRELELLRDTARNLSLMVDLDFEVAELRGVNEELWEIEELKREHERRKVFDQEFIELARQVYIKNDLRADIKRKINAMTSSRIQEVKSHFRPH